MNADRRQQLAEAAERQLGAAHRAVTESWPDLMPVSMSWTEAAARRARAAARAALDGVVPLLEQGDLDDRTWERIRNVVHADGRAPREEVAELLRSVRVVGVELLADRLAAEAALTQGERWMLQREVSAYCDDLLGEEAEPEGSAYAETLAELERSGTDLL